MRALVTFTSEVGATVLAEGIEVAEQIPALVDAGVTLGQFLTRPQATPLSPSDPLPRDDRSR